MRNCTADIGKVGQLGTNHDINVLMRSWLLKDAIFGRFTFRVRRTYYALMNGKEGTVPYLLMYITYPEFPFFIKRIKHTTSVKEQTSSVVQDGAWKDDE